MAGLSASAQPFSPKLVLGLVVAGLLAFAALVLLLAFGSNLNQPGTTEGTGHAASRAATGFSGLVALAGEFRDTRLVRDPAALDDENLLVVTLEPRTSPGELQRLLERRIGRPTLVILPKWATLPDPGHRGWVRTIGPGVGEMSGRLIDKDARVDIAENAPGGRVEGLGILEGLSVPAPDRPQTIADDEIEPLLTLRGGGTLLGKLRARAVYVAADPDLFNNHGMSNAATARAALRILDELNETGAREIDFDLTLNGPGGIQEQHPNMLRTVFEPPFLPMTLAMVVAALLAGLHGAFRFGPVRREARALPFGKAALVQNSAGLIRLARREASLGGAYAAVLRNEAARAAAAPQWLSDEQLDAYLDRLTRPGSERFSTLAARLRDADDRVSLIEAAQNLFQWKKDAIR